MLHTLPETQRGMEIHKGLSREYHKTYSAYHAYNERRSQLMREGDSPYISTLESDLTLLEQRMQNLRTRLSYVTGSLSTPFYAPSGSTPLHEVLTFFEVPEGDGFMRHTILYTIYEDMTAFSPSLTPQQNAILSDIVRAENAASPFSKRRGSSLSEMSDDESYHHARLIESLKSPHQLYREELETLVREVHLPLSESHYIEIEYIDDESQEGPTYQSFREEGAIREGDMLHCIHVSERKHYKGERLLSYYFIAESRLSKERSIVGACSPLNGVNARYVRTYIRDEELDPWDYPSYFDSDIEGE